MRTIERVGDQELLERAELLAPSSSSAVASAPTVADLLADSGVSALPKSPEPEAIEAALRSLADLVKNADPLRRQVVRNAASAALKACEVATPPALVDAAFGAATPVGASNEQGQVLTFEAPEPWPQPVDGAQLLEEIAAVHTRFVALPAGAATAAALWDLHTYVIDVLQVSPVLALTSPQKRCGKSTSLDVHRAIVRRPVGASNISSAALYRLVEKHSPTLLIDEADTFLAEREELRGVLNAGHTRSSAHVVRTTGDTHEPRIFRTFCPKAIAAIGRLPGTLEDRAITIQMQRRAKGEYVERLRRDRIDNELKPLRRKMVRWATDNAASIRDAEPSIPNALHDRAADNWRPLLGIADAVGGPWPARAREAAVKLSGDEASEESDVKVQLLDDIREAFSCLGKEKIATDALLKHLHSLPERPWNEWGKHPKPMNARGLASQLKPFRIQSKTVRLSTDTAKGYDLDDFLDAFRRYLPDRGVTASQAAPLLAKTTVLHPSQTEACDPLEMPTSAYSDAGCGVVSDAEPKKAGKAIDI